MGDRPRFLSPGNTSLSLAVLFAQKDQRFTKGKRSIIEEKMTMFRGRFLQGTALVIAVSQFIFGLAYLFAPAPFQAVLGLTHQPAWTVWPFGMLAARFLALGFGMLLVVRDPFAHRGWIQAMILVQAIDWVVVMIALLRGMVTLAQVATAPYLPIVFIACLLIAYPRQSTASVAGSAQAHP